MNIWNIVVFSAFMAIVLLIYMKHASHRKDQPLRIIPSGNPVLRIGTVPNVVEYSVESVTPCQGFGWQQFGEPVVIELKEPLFRTYGGFPAGTRHLVIDNRLVTARNREGDLVNSFEEKYDSSTVLTVHKTFFEKDLDNREVGELKQVLNKLDEETRERVKAQAIAASTATDEKILDRAKEIIKKSREVIEEKPIRRRFPLQGRYDERYYTSGGEEEHA